MLARKRIILIEDEPDISSLIAAHLKRAGSEVLEFGSGEDALPKIQARKCDLVILDWMLPGLSGIEIIRIIRLQAGLALRDLPILMVTAKDEPLDIVRGLESGANDYITKPFDMRVLLARANNLVRARAVLPQGEIIRVGELELNPSRFSARCGSQELSLTRSEFDILSALLSNAGRVLPRKLLLEITSRRGPDVTERTIDTHLFTLRKKLGDQAQMIETIRGVGYRLTEI